MVRSIIDHDDSVLPPVGINLVEMIAKFDQEKQERAAVVPPTVDREHQLPITTGSSYHAQRSQPLHSSDHVVLTWSAPSTLSLICFVKHCLINVNYDLTLDHILDEVRCRKLPLELCWKFVVCKVDRLHFPV